MKTQKGSLLIELSLVLGLLLLLSVGAATWLKHKADQQKVENLAHWMLSVQQGVQQYLDTNRQSLLQTSGSVSIAGFVNKWRPTVAELASTGFLARDFVSSNALQIQVQPVGCASDICHVEALITYSQPLLTRSGQVNFEATAHWLGQVRGQGYVVPLTAPGAAFAAGTVALLATTDTTEMLYLKLKETRNPEFQSDVDVGGSVRTDEDVEIGQFLYLPSLGKSQTACMAEGAMSRDDTQLLLCNKGVWQQVSRQSALDATHIRLGFELMLGFRANAFPLAMGGYYAQSLGGRGIRACWLLNPLTGSCSCPTTARRAERVGIKHVETYYSNSTYPDTRMLEIYGCLAS